MNFAEPQYVYILVFWQIQAMKSRRVYVTKQIVYLQDQDVN